jgi:hypothetical protein
MDGRLAGEQKLRGIFLALALMIGFLSAVGLVMWLKPGGSKSLQGRPELDVFAAGPEETYLNGSITYFEREHFYLVRLTDGAFLALYDLDAEMQRRVAAGDVTGLLCRVQLEEGEEMAALLEQAPGMTPFGFKDRGFRDACERSAWDATGRPVAGSETNLDRFPIGSFDGIVWVDLGNRRCMDPEMPGRACIPTQ